METTIIVFKDPAYKAIGYSNSYEGKFIKKGETYIECEEGELMTLSFRSFVTVGRELAGTVSSTRATTI